MYFILIGKKETHLYYNTFALLIFLLEVTDCGHTWSNLNIENDSRILIFLVKNLLILVYGLSIQACPIVSVFSDSESTGWEERI